MDRFLLLFIPDKYKPDHEYVRHVPNRWIHAFTLTQVGCIIILAVVKETEASIVFPIAVGHFFLTYVLTSSLNECITFPLWTTMGIAN